MSAGSVDAWVARIRAGDVVAAARLMRALDDEEPRAELAMRALHPHTGQALVVGVTGPPGSGKSTLVDALVAERRSAGARVGVVAVDPSSPVSGGALLGDRIRMNRHALDPGVFIRSLATRGALGGLSRAAWDVVAVFDAMGFDPILIETVGVGQDELDVAAAADAVVWVTVPGLGDEVQALKAGALEIADLFVVNKADREGADRAARDLATMLELRRGGRGETEILETVATTGAVAPLWAGIERHRTRLTAGGAVGLRARRRQQALTRVRALVLDRVRRRADAALAAALAPVIDDVLARVRDPRAAADDVLATLGLV